MALHEHVPVLFEEVLSMLVPMPGRVFIDATVGRTGHARGILDRTAPDGRLLGIDADGQAIDSARVSLRAFAGRVSLAQAYFDEIVDVAKDNGFGSVDGILFDLGISSTQLADASRGFSFLSEGPLDMRLRNAGRAAADIIATEDQAKLARIFREYGEERYANRIARRIVQERDRKPITTTRQLAELISREIPSKQSIHPATRVFQALRIAVNGELERLERALVGSMSLLASRGRLVVISFHSLEDRIVKQFMRNESRDCLCPPRTPQCVCGHGARLRLLTKKPILPSPAERMSNPRSRSAKLRAAEAI